jgi:hypothetical protein
MDEYEMPVESRATLEFKDGKAYFRENAEDESDEGMEYTADGDKLIVTMPDEAKEAGMESIEYSFDGDDLVMTMVQGGAEPGTMKFIFRRP